MSSYQIYDTQAPSTDAVFIGSQLFPQKSLTANLLITENSPQAHTETMQGRISVLNGRTYLRLTGQLEISAGGNVSSLNIQLPVAGNQVYFEDNASVFADWPVGWMPNVGQSQSFWVQEGANLVPTTAIVSGVGNIMLMGEFEASASLVLSGDILFARV